MEARKSNRDVGRIFLLLMILVAVTPPALAEPELTRTDLLCGGEGGYALYRIPGIIVTPAGTILVYCEARRSNSDWGEIDIVMRRSTDGGKTFSPTARAAEMPAGARRNAVAPAKAPVSDRGITLNNPVAIADRSGAVHLLYCVEYSRCFYRRSDDEGLTFSDPVEITATFEALRPRHDWKVIATGPGHGIQLTSGRLLVPVWLSLGTGANGHGSSCAATIYSDDGGRTWKAGEVVRPDELADGNECAAVELSDGAVMLNIRHPRPRKPGFRAVTTSPSGIGPWSSIRYDEQLPEPVCMAGIVRLDERRILFSNPHNPQGRERKNLTIKMSEDDGKSWPVARTLEPGPSGYSDLAVGADGSIYCFYERGETKPTEKLTFARFNLEWLTQSGSSR